MGLAAAIKRKQVGSQQPHTKRARAGGPPVAQAPAAAEANGRAANGQLHVISGSADTRSARRRQNRASREQAQAVQEAPDQQGQQQAGEGGSSSDDEGGPLEVVLNGTAVGSREELGIVEEAEEGLPAAGSAYRALLASLKASSREFARQRLRREREEAGLDESEESEDEEGEEEEEEAEEEREDEELAEEAGAQEAEDTGRQCRAEESSGEEEGGGDEAQQDGSGSGSDQDREQQQEQQPGQHRPDSGTQEEEEAAEASEACAVGVAAAAAAAGGDGYASHFERELTEEEAAALQAAAAPGGCGRQFRPRPDAPRQLRQWRGVELQTSEGMDAMPEAPAQLAAYGVKERVANRWREVVLAQPQQQQPQQRQQAANGRAASTAGPQGEFVNAQQRALFALLSSYSDLLLPCRPYPTDTAAPDPELDAVLLHVLSHCAKAADRIKRNNEHIKAAAEAGTPLEDTPRDQGFTRPKALFLLPLRASALRVALRLAALAVRETRSDSVQGRPRLLAEFGVEGEEDEGELPPRAATARARRPAEHTALFSGNLDDHFRLGIRITRGAVRLFADFLQSDIVLASPVALATKLAEKEEGAADFLSSIEIVVVERADVLLMQNWEHVRTVFAALNRLPSQQRGVDIMRIWPWALSGWGRLYRQTVLLSSFASPEMNALLARACANYAGCIRLKPSYKGVLSGVVPQVRQVFERLPPATASLAAAAAASANGSSGGSSALAIEADSRLEQFKRQGWPRLKEALGGGGQLLYIPSYFDFVRVRNFLKAEGASFLVLSEYVEPADAARARSYFFTRRRPLLLLTERAQFYHRYSIRGIKDIFFYQLPEHPQLYPELLNLLEESAAAAWGTVHVLFSRTDAPRLERVVGSDRAAKMLKRGSTSTFLFC